MPAIALAKAGWENSDFGRSLSEFKYLVIIHHSVFDIRFSDFKCVSERDFSSKTGIIPYEQDSPPPEQGFDPSEQEFTRLNRGLTPSEHEFTRLNRGLTPSDQEFNPPEQAFEPSDN